MIDELRRKISPRIREGEVLAPFTTFRLGGPAEYYLEAETAEEAVSAIRTCRELGIPIYFIGGGSNMLVSDGGIRGLTVRMKNAVIGIDGTDVMVGSGMPSGKLAWETVRAGLSGLEWMIGLPGTVGGAVRGNAGMFGGETKDTLTSVLACTPEGEVSLMSAEECRFRYRHSIFKKLPGTIILSVHFSLRPSDVAACQATMRDFLKRKAATQPVNGFTAGCTFKNWLPGNEADLSAIRRALDLNDEETVPRGVNDTVPAGWIIDRAQLKGMRIGGASISDRHGNFILNDGTATASDVLALVAAIKMKVRDLTHGIIMLEEEIEYVGF